MSQISYYHSFNVNFLKSELKSARRTLREEQIECVCFEASPRDVNMSQSLQLGAFPAKKAFRSRKHAKVSCSASPTTSRSPAATGQVSVRNSIW